jgi:hypothetical protein
MPTFCFTNPNSGETVERVFSVMRIPKRILIQGEVFLRDISAEHRGESYKIRKRKCGVWQKSDAAGCHPLQAAEYERDAAERGVPTEFDRRTGQAIFRSREHRKRYCESRGIYDRSGGYGDPQQRERVEVPNKDQIDYDRSDAKFVAGED